MSAPSDIPGARVLLGEVKDILRLPHIMPIDRQIALAKIDEALLKMRRATALTKARVKSRKMTPGLAAEIKEFYRRHPAMSQEDVARQFGVKGGRVSEALHGQWDAPYGLKWLRYREADGGRKDA